MFKKRFLKQDRAVNLIDLDISQIELCSSISTNENKYYNMINEEQLKIKDAQIKKVQDDAIKFFSLMTFNGEVKNGTVELNGKAKDVLFSLQKK